MNTFDDQEIQRIRAEYTRRDILGLSRIYSYANPAFVFHIQEREWAILRLLRSEEVKLNGITVLEIGCGTGHILQRFMEFGVQLAVGIDLMESRIEAGKKHYPNLHLAIGNGAQLPYADNSFDLVMQFMCLSSVLDPEMRQQIADEMWRVLRPGGTILCYDLRPAPYVVGLFFMPYYALRKILGIFTSRGKKIPSAGEEPNHSTPIRPIPITEVKKLFSRGVMRYSAVSLNFNLCRIAGKSFFLATILSRMVFLRSHYLALVRKPT
jgi:ubiquinone/menaquinone biosynthesis C-methylase UbiE